MHQKYSDLISIENLPISLSSHKNDMSLVSFSDILIGDISNACLQTYRNNRICEKKPTF